MTTGRSVRAFTLIELLLVMVILVVLSGLVAVRFTQHRQKASIAAAKTDIRNYETAITTFQIDCGRFPTDEEGLSALVTNPGVAGWGGPYVKFVTSDPWGNPFIYQAPGAYLPDMFDLYSCGPDKQPGNEDDIVNWRSG